MVMATSDKPRVLGRPVNRFAGRRFEHEKEDFDEVDGSGEMVQRQQGVWLY